MSAPLLLDWSYPRHHAADPRPCRHCHGPTPLRDDTGRPAHKVCAELDAVAELHRYERMRRDAD